MYKLCSTHYLRSTQGQQKYRFEILKKNVIFKMAFHNLGLPEKTKKNNFFLN